METLLKDLCENKRVLILGFGREGKSTMKLLLSCCDSVDITIGDRALLSLTSIMEEISVDTYNKTQEKNINVSIVCGEEYQKTIDDFDVVFKSPGIVLERNFDSYKAVITSQAQEFIKRYRERVIGITGTKGKSTTTTLLYKIFSDSSIKSVMGGNIGIPPFELVSSMEEDKNTVAVVELSCHQLEYMTVSPHIAVLLNLYEEHLDHYGTYEKYARAKENIYRFQKQDDFLICKKDIVPYAEEFENKPPHIAAVHQEGARESVIRHKEKAETACAPVYCMEIEDELIKIQGGGENIINIPKDYHIPAESLKLHGNHNYFNVAVCYGISMLLGIDVKAFEDALISYSPLPHRLEFIGIYDDIYYYDDSISTIGEAAIQAANSIKNIDTVLIGGMDRGIDYTQLEDFLSSSSVPNIILMYETGRRIYKEMQEKGYCLNNIYVVENLKEAVKKAAEVTRKGRACVMSPAAASYGYFKNFEERGEVFAKLVKEGKHSK